MVANGHCGFGSKVASRDDECMIPSIATKALARECTIRLRTLRGLESLRSLLLPFSTSLAKHV